MSFLDKSGLAQLWTKILDVADTKVDKIDGKKLSSNDFTDEYKNILEAGLATETFVASAIQEALDQFINAEGVSF